MKEVVIRNNKKEMYKNKLITFILAALICFLFGRNIVAGINTQKEGYFVEEQITVISSTVEDKTNYLTIKALDSSSNEKTYLCGDVNLVLAENDELTLTLCNVNNVCKIVKNGETILDQVADIKKTGVTYIIFGAIVCAAVLIFVTVTVISIAKKPAEERHDFVDYSLNQSGNITSRMINKKSKTRKYLNIYNYIVAGLIMILLIGILLIGRFEIKKEVLTLIYIIAAAFYVISIVLLILFRPQFTSKHLDMYVNDYLDYLNNGPDSEYETAYIIQDNKLVYNSEKPREYELDKLNLYTAVIYKGGFYGFNIFLVSDMTDLGDYQYDCIIPLTHRFYNDLKAKGLEVKNLDYCLSHLKEEATIHAPKALKKVKAVKYNE